MKTRRPISSVWYGSSEFLKMQLDNQVKLSNIIFYAFIYHHKEEDEKKDHIHLYIVPNGEINTETLSNIITEIDLTNDKPFKLLPFRFSKFDDWYLYNCHDTNYLLSKGQTRKYHYKRDDFISSEPDYLLEMIHQIDFSKINRIELIREAVDNQIPFEQLLLNGQIPVQLIKQFKDTYDMLSGYKIKLDNTFRNGNANHE